MNYKVRLAKKEDLNEILSIYKEARAFMRSHGNDVQWNNNFPPQELLENDIDKKQLYVIDADKLYGVFAFIIGKEKTYDYIEGKWLSTNPYGTIHRLASTNEGKNIGKICFDYCTSLKNSQLLSLRVDTHEKNIKMQHVISNNNFVKCGIIYVEDKTPRLAYERIL